MLKAAIDLGTVTSRLMIGEVNNHDVEIIAREIVITDLGEGLSESGSISSQAYERLTAALLSFRECIDRTQEAHTAGAGHTQIPVKIVATSAMRDAKNSAEIVAELKTKGFDLEVISGTREAELSFLGTLSGFKDLDEPVLTIDVGGGSTELILGTNASEILNSHSFNIGSRRITELFLKSDPITPEELDKAKAWVVEQTKSFIALLPEQLGKIIAVAGTATSAITVRDEIVEYDTNRVHGQQLSLEELNKITTDLAVLQLEERRLVAGLHPKRAPVIVGGLIILSTLLEEIGCDSLLVSDTDILQGIILSHRY